MRTIKEEINYIKMRNTIFNSLINYAENDGFIKVESDLFEDLFDFVNTNNRFNIKDLIKLEDQKGDLFILRPDITTNIIKQVIPRISPKDELKLFYLDKIYSYDDDGRMSGVRQFGVEMIGGNTFDKEVELLLFIEGLIDQYRMPYVIEIGNQLFIDILIGEITKDPSRKSLIKDALMRKNKSRLMDQIKTETPYTNLLYLILEPSGSLDDIKGYIKKNQLNLILIDEIDRILDITEKMNQENITIDLSLVSPYDYYNGPIFKGYINGYSKDVFRGGRYDTLTTNYGSLTRALGFSLDMNVLMKEVMNRE